MTAFDYVILALVTVSAAIGVWRGVIREVFALGAWVVAIVCMVLFGQTVAAALPLSGQAPWLQSLAGYATVFIVVFVSLSVLGFLFTKMVRAVGLSFIDRALGMMFGMVRGALIAVLLVLVAGATGLPQTDWWKESASAKPLETFAALLRSKFPDDLAKRFKVAAGSALPGGEGLAERVYAPQTKPNKPYIPSPQPSPPEGGSQTAFTVKDFLCVA
ncbi:MAG: CvpA family protein [Betaproteobacteria bacterium]|nr:MAG: CvpA family protein [Betaproteobacteria bacterium]